MTQKIKPEVSVMKSRCTLNENEVLVVEVPHQRRAQVCRYWNKAAHEKALREHILQTDNCQLDLDANPSVEEIKAEVYRDLSTYYVATGPSELAELVAVIERTQPHQWAAILAEIEREAYEATEDDDDETEEEELTPAASPIGRHLILSGEGASGTWTWAKATTPAGLKRELARERCGGDRWAHGYEVTGYADDEKTTLRVACVDKDETRDVSLCNIKEAR
jgi:hypothetical protein